MDQNNATIDQDRPMPEPDTWTQPRQFRLPQATLDEIDYLRTRLALRSRADVIRFLVRREAAREGYQPEKNSEKSGK